MSKSKQPHTAIVLLKIEVHPNLDTGECSGYPLASSELTDAGLQNVQVIHIKGFDKSDCLNKLKAKIAELKK